MLAIVQMALWALAHTQTFCGSGPMWDKFPLVKVNLKHEAKDDGKESISLFH